MDTVHDALSLKVARNLTAHLQLLQVLVGRDCYRHWVGGRLAGAKLASLAQKFADRYPTLVGNNRRAYDTKCGRASVRFLVYPDGDQFAWLLISTAGKGGLADPASPDFSSARDAMAADSHITCRDYVLLYATKKEPRLVKGKTILKTISTWTWKLRPEVFSGAKASIDDNIKALAYGAEGPKSFGLRGYLEKQRNRPLLSGVRTQVIELHKHAQSQWGLVRPAWLAKHPHYAKQYGNAAGALLPIKQVIHTRLPKSVRITVYGDTPQTLGGLLAAAPVATAAVPAEV